MTRLCRLAVSLSCAALPLPLLYAGDLSRYRSFQLGTDLPTIARQIQMDPSQAKVIHQRPALIQALTWRPQSLGASTEVEAVEEAVLSFYKGELYQIVVTYDRHTTEGLTAQDLTEALSAIYGTAAKGAAQIIVPSPYGDNETVEVLARWEDAQYSLNLVRFSYQRSFSLVALSKRLDPLARAAVTEALRLDAQEAPQREIELEKKQAEDNRVQQQKARQANKPSFRP